MSYIAPNYKRFTGTMCLALAVIVMAKSITLVNVLEIKKEEVTKLYFVPCLRIYMMGSLSCFCTEPPTLLIKKSER